MSDSRLPERETIDALERQHGRILAMSRCVAVVLTLVLVLLMCRVVQLSIWPNDVIRAEAAKRHSAIKMIGRRGTLTDRHGRVLGTSNVGYCLYIDPKVVEDLDSLASRLGIAIGVDPALIDRHIGMAKSRRYVVIDDLLSDEQIEAVRGLGIHGVGLGERLVREYPADTVAGQVIGFVGSEHRGMDGVEYRFDQELRGDGGKLRYLRDVRRRTVWVEPDDFKPSCDGDDVKLSLDLVIQEIAEEELGAQAEKYGAKRAELVVMDSENGQILAMVNWPWFDPNVGGGGDVGLRRNRCVTDVYEPGSIFKPFVFAGATAMGVADPFEKIDCSEKGYYRFDFGRTIHDAHGHGVLRWDDVLVKSSNIGMGIVGRRFGKDRMYETVCGFGFGMVTGSGLPGESGGIVNPVAKWTKYSETSVPMGQEIAVTPLQVARAFSAFANGGVMVSPSIWACDGAVLLHQRAIDKETANHVRGVLRRVVSDGTGRRAKSSLYKIWGKTGTAQVVDRVAGGYVEDAYASSFVCGAPFMEPRVVVVVVLHEPDKSKGYYGGTVAAPVARRVVERTLMYLGVASDVACDDEVDCTRLVRSE